MSRLLCQGGLLVVCVGAETCRQQLLLWWEKQHLAAVTSTCNYSFIALAKLLPKVFFATRRREMLAANFCLSVRMAIEDFLCRNVSLSVKCSVCLLFIITGFMIWRLSTSCTWGRYFCNCLCLDSILRLTAFWFLWKSIYPRESISLALRLKYTVWSLPSTCQRK